MKWILSIVLKVTEQTINWRNSFSTWQTQRPHSCSSLVNISVEGKKCNWICTGRQTGSQTHSLNHLDKLSNKTINTITASTDDGAVLSCDVIMWWLPVTTYQQQTWASAVNMLISTVQWREVIMPPCHHTIMTAYHPTTIPSCHNTILPSCHHTIMTP